MVKLVIAMYLLGRYNKQMKLTTINKEDGVCL